MKIGITGHQERDGIDWMWVRLHIDRFLAGKAQPLGYSCLAVGSDQVFADAILQAGGHLTAVVPLEGYESFFKDDGFRMYNRLLSLSQVVELNSKKRDEQAFLDAGKWIVRKVDYLIAVWDGEAADGAGGTADIVAYAELLGKPVVHLDPINLKVSNF